MATVLLLNGPNLNLLGQREPELYGTTTLPQIEEALRTQVEGAGHDLRAFQSNAEGALVDWLQAQRDADFLLINAGAYTHTSVAIRDALKLTGLPFIEIHLSNVFAREPFRHQSYLSDLAIGGVAGLGAQGYELAARYALAHLARKLASTK
jgi:3-dehydroquinate dehydratase-2